MCHIQWIYTVCVKFSGYLNYVSYSVDTYSMCHIQWIPTVYVNRKCNAHLSYISTPYPGDTYIVCHIQWLPTVYVTVSEYRQCVLYAVDT